MNDRDIKGISRIIVHIEFILDYMKEINSSEAFNQNQLIVDAVVFNLSQIGEISRYRISSSLKDSTINIPWHEMYGFRNRIVHDYDQINMNVVYDTVKEDLPNLLAQLISLKNGNSNKRYIKISFL
jgi:uncharacterized protein with HEPN domain